MVIHIHIIEKNSSNITPETIKFFKSLMILQEYFKKVIRKYIIII